NSYFSLGSLNGSHARTASIAVSARDRNVGSSFPFMTVGVSVDLPSGFRRKRIFTIISGGTFGTGFHLRCFQNRILWPNAPSSEVLTTHSLLRPYQLFRSPFSCSLTISVGATYAAFGLKGSYGVYLGTNRQRANASDVKNRPLASASLKTAL